MWDPVSEERELVDDITSVWNLEMATTLLWGPLILSKGHCAAELGFHARTFPFSWDREVSITSDSQQILSPLHCPGLRSAHEASPAGSEAGLPGVIKKQVGGLHVLNSCFQRDYRPVLSIKENHRFQRSNRPHHQIKKAEKIDANSWSWF